MPNRNKRYHSNHGRNGSDHFTLTTGPVWRHPDTNFVIVSLLNDSDSPQEVTVSILDWQTCDHPEFTKFAYTCGGTSTDELSIANNESTNLDNGETNNDSPAIEAVDTPLPCDPISDSTCCNPISTPEGCSPPIGPEPFTFTIQPGSTVTIYGVPRTSWVPPAPIFEVRVSLRFTPPSPITPPAPIRVNVFGINANGVPQVGNVLFHSNLVIAPTDSI